MRRSWTLVAALALAASGLVSGGLHEKKLLNDLLDSYNVLERPVGNESEALVLSFGLTLMQIIDVDEKNQLLITNLWLKLEWNDVNMRWNVEEYGGVRDLRIPPHRLWKPDVLMYNSADEGFDGTYPTNVVVKNNGTCMYVPPGIFKSTCKIDITWFPFDDQRCEMKFGSWTYDGFQLDLQLQDETGGDISSFITNGEWDLLGVPGKRNEIYYNCCPEPYGHHFRRVDITFVVIIRRRTLYYFFNLIVPCVLIASMAVLGFTLPPDSGEKLSLGVTILLSLTVFLNMVAETMPATSDAVPLLGTYFNCIMFMVASSVVSTILILNYHHRKADSHEMGRWVRILFLYWLPRVLRMSRPGQEEEKEAVQKSQKPSPVTGASKSYGDLELHQRSSKSLLANVLDLDDNALASHNNLLNNVYSTPGPHHAHAMGHGHSHIHTTPHHHHSHAPTTPHHQHATPLPHSSYPGHQISHTPHHHPHPQDASTPQVETILQNACFCARYELVLILKEIKIITNQLKSEDENTKVTNDWKFAAMVIDRMCLIIFTLFTIIATITVLLSAPHIIVT
ncbi:LOW QUALITY PROTEIN: neuronal acetylcholine receptor subunit alpha-7 [Solenopsis invicta]|uniref:LOW QUALITY PROTEIN: neuronal acetylcholine receptor subunit alpha-7 n=1 Tax=Solenopsis invicta TaxID=13686 RepID=UPI00193CD919|nr:LOW QUALITY PROTEIN: neuronal acetylcholine receptor subunit alpha-7 [Solenopsis invicta]